MREKQGFRIFLILSGPKFHCCGVLAAVFLLGGVSLASAQSYSNTMWSRPTPPPHLANTNRTSERLYKMGYVNVLWYDGWNGNPVDPTGNQISTKGLQKAIDDAYDYQLTLYIPQGTYLIDDTLWVVRKHWKGGDFHANTIVGSDKNGQRPVIRLKANASGFGNASSPKAALHFFTVRQEYFQPFGTPGADYNSDDTFARDSVAFMESIHDVDIDLNGDNGNAGAVGINFGAAQTSDIYNVKVDATGAYAGFYDIPSRSSAGAANVEVIGGQYGLYLETGAGSILVGLTLKNQTVAALRSENFVPISVVGFHIVKQAGAAITQIDSWSSAGGTMSLHDGIIEMGDGSPAIDNMVGNNFYMRNVYVKGTNTIVSVPGHTVDGSGEWVHVKEYFYTDQKTYAGDPPYDSGDSNFEAFSLINGQVGKEEGVDIQDNAGGPPADLVSRHLWDKLPSVDDDDYVVLTEVSNADGMDDADDWAAIQGAVNQYDKILVPKGHFRLSQTLTLRANTTLFGVSKAHSRIFSHPDWNPTSEVAVIETVDDADATTYLGTIHIGYQVGILENDWFTALHWRAGLNSMVMDVTEKYGDEKEAYPSDKHTTNPHSLFKITGNGGGRWYFFGVDRKLYGTHLGYRHLLIDGTQEPLVFYGCNLEKGRGDSRAEARNAQNIRAYNIKVESHKTVWLVNNSRNIGLFDGGAMRTLQNGEPVYHIINGSDGVLVANINPQSYHMPGVNTVEEDLGYGVIGIEHPNMVSVYKRGVVDDEAVFGAFEGSGSPTPPPSHEVLIADTRVIVDADLGEYVNAEAITLTNVRGTTGQYRFLYDTAYLYIAAEVTDNTLNADAMMRDGRTWMDDSLEVMLDTLNNGGPARLDDDYKFYVNILNTQRDEQGTGGLSWNSSGMTSAVQTEPGGYRIEAAIPWADIGVSPSPGKTLGFELMLNDQDNAGVREYAVWSNISGGDVNDPNGWGDMELSKQTVGEEVNKSNQFASSGISLGLTGDVVSEIIFGRTGDVVKESWLPTEFVSAFDAAPVILAGMQTTDGGDASGLRIQNLSSTGFEVMVEEETSADIETNHTSEDVGYLALETGDIVDSRGQVIGEAGSLAVRQAGGDEWHTLPFSRNYVDPVVLMQITSFAGGQPSHMRVRGISAGSAEFQIEEWDYLDGGHTQEDVSYIVVETGVHNLNDGRLLEAGTVQGNNSWQTVSLSEGFTSAPVVISMPLSNNEAQAVVARQRNGSATGFDVRLQEEEGNNDLHATETIGYISVGDGKTASDAAPPALGTAENVVAVIQVKLQVPADTSTYYTTDGSDPTEASMLYTKPFTILKGSTVKFRSYRSGYYPSAVETIMVE